MLGFFVRVHGSSTIYVEHGLPRGLLLGTLAHELGHAWQAERAPTCAIRCSARASPNGRRTMCW